MLAGAVLLHWAIHRGRRPNAALGAFAFMSSNTISPGKLIAWIMLAVLVWGGLLALGAYLYGGPRQLLRAGMILGCVIAFLSFWGILLKYRAGGV